MNCIEARHHIHAYMDGELDLLQTLSIEGHLLACATCKQIHAQHAAARVILRRHATRFTAPAALRARVQNLVVPAGQRGRRSWFPQRALKRPSFAAALAFAVTLTWAVSAHLPVPATGERLPEEIVSSHVRALISGRLADVESPDPRDVKAWLHGKLGYSPRVDDLAQHGYALVGGRIDYIREHRVAALVYRHLGHPIDVFVWHDTGHDPLTQYISRKGYNLINWKNGGLFFCAVSDLDHAEIAEFARLIQRNAG
jgi:anti-sigma factor RsiW